MFSNLQKASLSALLSIMDGDIELIRYNLKKAKNASLYNIKAKDGSFNYFIDFSKDENVDDLFRDVVRKVYNNVSNNDFPIEYFSDNFAINCVVDIVNDYINLDTDKLSNYEKMQSNYDRLGIYLDYLTDIYQSEANYATKEPVFIQLTGDLCEEIQYYMTSGENTKMTYGTLQDTLETFETSASDNLKQHIINENAKWVRRAERPSINSYNNKQRAKLLTMALLSHDVQPQVFLATRFDNTLGIKIQPINPKYSDKSVQSFFHNKKHCEVDTLNFKRDFYDMFLDIRGFERAKSAQIQSKESLIFECIKENFSKESLIDRTFNEINAKRLFQSYKDILQRINFGADHTIFSSAVLNVASIQGDTGVTKNISDLYNYTAEEIAEFFDRNYELVEQDPTITLKAINNLQKNKNKKKTQSKQNSPFDDFIKHMNTKYPNMRVIPIDMSNPDNIPPFIKEQLENMGILPNQNGEVPPMWDKDEDTDNPSK